MKSQETHQIDTDNKSTGQLGRQPDSSSTSGIHRSQRLFTLSFVGEKGHPEGRYLCTTAALVTRSQGHSHLELC